MSPSSQRVAGLSFPQLVHFIVVIPPVNDNLAEYLNCIYIEQAQAASETISLSAICKYVSDKAIFSHIGSPVYISTENILPANRESLLSV